MNQRNQAEGPSNAGSDVPISSEDLLTGSELAATMPLNIPQEPEVVPQRQTPQPQQQGIDPAQIPDVHKMEGVPNAARRMEIAQQVDAQMNKVESIDDQIRKDVEAAQNKKFEGTPRTPKEVLKNLIAKGEYSEDFDLFGQKWTLRALDQGDTILSLDEVRDTIETQSGRILALMFGTITFAIEAVNGIPIYEWFEELKLADFNNDRMEYHIAVRKALRKYLEAMPPGVIDALYEKYLALEARRAKALEELKNS